MFAIIESLDIYKRVMEVVTEFFANPTAYLNTWNEKPFELTENAGEVFLDTRKLELIKFLPSDLAMAIRNSKRLVTQKLFDGGEIIVVKTIACSQDGMGECRIFPWGIRYITKTEKGFWQFEWHESRIRFSGYRNSFLNGNNGLFSYKPGELKIIRLLTSEPNIPLIFQGAEITPDEVIETKYKDEEKEEFYLPLKVRDRIIQEDGI